MQVPTAQLAHGLKEFLTRKFGAQIGYASDEEAALAAIAMIEAQARRGRAGDLAEVRDLSHALKPLSGDAALPAVAPDLHAALQAFAARLQDAGFLDTTLLAELEALLSRFMADRRLSPAQKGAAIRVAQWDAARLNGLAGSAADGNDAGDDGVTAEKLRQYLVERLEDPTLELTGVQRVSGGFGKETVLFSARGNGLDGDFVLRRDRARPTLENDCHNVEAEYPVVREVFKAGFPAPDALWIETASTAIPGSFFVMKRARGRVIGDVFGSSGKLPEGAFTALAQGIGRLHRLPPMHQLGDLTPSIRSDLWSMPIGEVTRDYIRGFFALYRREQELAVPGLGALEGWLLDNVPSPDGAPALLHGDVGLQNILFDGDALSVVLDWEFAHIGDPAEDVAYVRNTAGPHLDWRRFLDDYRSTSGIEFDPARLHYFRVWGYCRNALAAALATNCFATGRLDNLNIAHVGFFYLPRFVEAATRLIMDGPERLD
ncbi:hypothetical protein A0J57_03930 [Sphingobium sp. 22B]|uniref:phosphotransferase family protein n=1 Tax=unclassified Sphingobium TaxID=2611147 RepID=UPI00078675B2|nr:MULTISPECIES: phosphotransferase family protein [unclassified Sphingobium]KXU33798.1 hypothetical protein AXW74_00480 [Sphingobium sp. AM]KYC33743.1 hypothetical protein A0J57_03930 [Sphingobium sp. 22B]OAP33482.1 hypothetical protein A8O16_03150 [Sphingobium sp. 20006FA]